MENKLSIHSKIATTLNVKPYNKMFNNSLELFSANWVTNLGKPSNVRLGQKLILLNRGMNILGIKNKELTLLISFDTCNTDYGSEIQQYLKTLYDNMYYDYLIMITHDDAKNKTNPTILQNYLIFLGCKELKNLLFRASYAFIYDLKRRNIVFELCDNKFPIHEWFEVIDNDTYYSFNNLGIPIYLIVYNYLYFTKNSIDQLKKYTKNIHIIDNNSTYPKLLEYYDNEYEFFLEKMDSNYGHLVWKNKLGWQMPRYYIISDPDLQYNQNLPENFITTIRKLSDEHKKGKVGFALDLSDAHLFYKYDNYIDGISIKSFELKYWIHKIEHPSLELYDANIDTTFCLVNREYYKDKDDGIRIAGNYTCKHIPWYIDWNNKLDNEEWEFYKKHNISSGILKLMNNINKLEISHCTNTLNELNVLTNKVNDLLIGLNQENISEEFNDVKKNLSKCVDLLTDNKVIVSKALHNKTQNK
ncbi:interleukin-like EMT inducer domain-containing protein [Fadolivirus algeromassiliense]|jgi:hypothetical protein|uniref:Interleukin-like EMT inducer domain-containing protein n=1 Tax=Fadolivirus FV1/VV64 TaxID=3070911 RepID=A0A7D3QTS0_9VIRU|nr:interleukin-like EMT inducer domain-containing protein [Fadolivirus algeromassiliense]QKF93543.1 interleukin-like EMT inducer domain-containing protein [Fadolivirus FV1/VV64]